MVVRRQPSTRDTTITGLPVADHSVDADAEVHAPWVSLQVQVHGFNETVYKDHRVFLNSVRLR